MERNIVYFDQGQLLSISWRDSHFLLHNNIYFDRRNTDLRIEGDSFAKWQAAGKDQGSVVADPCLSTRTTMIFAFVLIRRQ